MKVFKLYSEKFRPEGGAAAQGIGRAMGRPRLDQISVLIREAVQNSWDARLEERNASVEVSARLEVFGPAELRILKDEIFKFLPSHHPLKENLRPSLRRLIIEDRGTHGLTGPVFLERSPRPEDRFVNFCRIFGRASEGALGGGTFGYGKAVYFGASRAATVIIHTRCLHKGHLEERLMPMSVWRTNSSDISTGRHWWGVTSKRHNGAVAPVTGTDAKKIAKQIGFTGFSGDETGTSIMILAPRFDARLDLDPLMATRCIAETMTIWFWPRMLGAGDKAGKLKFSAACDGEPVSIPDPAKTIPFRGYAMALKNLVAQTRSSDRTTQLPHVVKEVRALRPAARLGYLSLALVARRTRNSFAISSQIDGSALFEDHAFGEQVDDSPDRISSCHHVAMVRAPGQVIKYVAYRPYPAHEMEYAGIFLVDGDPEHDDRPSDDVDIAFARAEPPSHDDWVPDNLDDEWHKRYVRAARRSISTIVDEFVGMGKPQVAASAQDPLGALSADLGELMAAPGTGASRSTITRPRTEGGGTGGTGGSGGGEGGGSQGGGAQKGAQIVVTGDGTLETINGKIVFALPFRVNNLSRAFTRIRAVPNVLLAGGASEIDPPAGDRRPRVVGWRREGKSVVQQLELKLRDGDDGDWQVLVEVPSDVMVGVSLSVVTS